MVVFEKVSMAQVSILQQFSLITFKHSFYHQNAPENYELYIATAFSKETLLKELNDLNSEFYFGFNQEELVCYFKLNFNINCHELRLGDSLEIQRIYVSPAHLSKGIGAEAIAFIKNYSLARGCKNIWLGVWERNPKAIKFYERQGFKIVGKHGFMLGYEAQTDLIMECEI